MFLEQPLAMPLSLLNMLLKRKLQISVAFVCYSPFVYPIQFMSVEQKQEAQRKINCIEVLLKESNTGNSTSMYLLADLGKARGCSKNSLVIN